MSALKLSFRTLLTVPVFLALLVGPVSADEIIPPEEKGLEAQIDEIFGTANGHIESVIFFPIPVGPLADTDQADPPEDNRPQPEPPW